MTIRKKARKTYLEDFLKKFPEAILDSRGYPYSCLEYLYGKNHSPSDSNSLCNSSCAECWNRVMSEERR